MHKIFQLDSDARICPPYQSDVICQRTRHGKRAHSTSSSCSSSVLCLKVQAKLDNIIYFVKGSPSLAKHRHNPQSLFVRVLVMRPLNISWLTIFAIANSPLYPCGMQTPRRYHSTSAKWHSDLPGLGTVARLLQLPKSAKSSNCGSSFS